MKKSWVLVFAILMSATIAAETSYDDLVNLKLIASGEKPALHLGCGDVHLNGYINIDFPKENRPLHTGFAADYYADVTRLRFPRNSVSKIENHHMFEHFPRPVSLALLCAWQIWLQDQGELVIETPDFDQGIQRYLTSRSFEEKQIIIRHLYGSHEEQWAVHWDGWYGEKFMRILTALGFEIVSMRQFSWFCIDNVEVIAKKTRKYSVAELRAIAQTLLKLSMVNASEASMWQKWCADFNQALDLMIDGKEA